MFLGHSFIIIKWILFPKILFPKSPHNYAQKSMVPFKIPKSFIRFIALSTWIRRFASSFVFLTSDFVIWFFILAPGGTTNLWKWKTNLLEKHLSAITSWSLSNNHKNYYLWWEERNEINRVGVIPAKKLSVLWCLMSDHVATWADNDFDLSVNSSVQYMITRHFP